MPRKRKPNPEQRERAIPVPAADREQPEAPVMPCWCCGIKFHLEANLLSHRERHHAA